MQFLNQYSFLLTAVVSIGILAIVLLRDGVRGSDLVALASLTIGFIAAFWLLRPSPSSVSSAEQLLSQIGDGRPVLLEFQSPY